MLQKYIQNTKGEDNKTRKFYFLYSYINKEVHPTRSLLIREQSSTFHIN